MVEIREMTLGSFENINGNNFYRLKNGKIAVNNMENIIIEAKENDKIDLITLKNSNKVVRFWKIGKEIYLFKGLKKSEENICLILLKNKINSLKSLNEFNVSDTLENIIFCELYEGLKVKYTYSNNCGIFEINKEGIREIISYEKGYIDIIYENELYYAKHKEDKEKYHILDSNGNIIEKSVLKSIMVKGNRIFYDQHKIFTNQKTIEMEEIIFSVKGIISHELAIIKVVTSKGVYYYTNELLYLIGPMGKEKITGIDKNSCYIFEKDIKGNIINVLYIRYEKDNYICKELSSTKGIEVYLYFNNINVDFFGISNRLYLLDRRKEHTKDFELLIEKENINYYKIILENKENNVINIIGYKDDKPSLFVSYFLPYEAEEGRINYKFDIEFVEEGHNGDFICKEKDFDNKFTVITKTGEILFRNTAQKCHARRINYKDMYILENCNSIKLYWASGKEVKVKEPDFYYDDDIYIFNI